jgi:hypothetical protein
MFAKTGERMMTECSTPIMEATDTTKAEATEEMTISNEPTTTGEVSTQKAVVQMPEQTASKRRAPRVKFQRIDADLARVYPPDGDTKLWWSVNAALAMIEAAQRRDEIEGVLAVQMACTHTAAMAVLARLRNGYGGERRVVPPARRAIAIIAIPSTRASHQD